MEVCPPASAGRVGVDAIGTSWSQAIEPEENLESRGILADEGTARRGRLPWMLFPPVR